jgi:hypothetical protein
MKNKTPDIDWLMLFCYTIPAADFTVFITAIKSRKLERGCEGLEWTYLAHDRLNFFFVL